MSVKMKSCILNKHYTNTRIVDENVGKIYKLEMNLLQHICFGSFAASFCHCESATCIALFTVLPLARKHKKKEKRKITRNKMIKY